MVLPTNIRNNLGSGTVNTRTGSTGTIFGNSSDPTTRIENSIAQGTFQGSGQYTFPKDLPRVYINIMENEWNIFEGAGQVDTKLGNQGLIDYAKRIFSAVKELSKTSLKPQRLYRLPLPLQLKDAFEVAYNTDYGLNPLSNLNNTAAAATTGGIINAFKTVTMSQPTFRRHQLSWKLSPKNYDEAVIAQRIAFQLRKGMTPKTSGTVDLGKFALFFPKIYTMWFHDNIKFMYKFKPCVLERIEVDYAGGNPIPAFYRPEGGSTKNMAPESLTISAVFLELEYWIDTRDENGNTDYDQDGDGHPTDSVTDAYNFYKFTQG